jgi:hypothetical protein
MAIKEKQKFIMVIPLIPNLEISFPSIIKLPKLNFSENRVN